MKRVLIVGAGIIGLFSAYFLSRKKNISITIIDKQSFGQEASWAGGGIVSSLYSWRYPDKVTRLATTSQQYYPQIVTHLQTDTKLELEYFLSGMCLLNPESTSTILKWCKQHTKACEILTAKQVNLMFPDLSVSVKEALFFKEVCNIRNPRLLKALITYLTKQKNVTCLPFTPCLKLNTRNNIVSSISVPEKKLEFDEIVLCAGAYTENLLSQLGKFDFKILPVKGQMLMWEVPNNWLSSIVLYNDYYIIPRASQHVLVGATVELGINNKLPTKEAYKHLTDVAYEMFPSLRNFPLTAHWAGIRPGCNQQEPVIGKIPGFDNAFIAAGHYRDGLLLAPATGMKIAEMITEDQHSVF